MKRKFNFELTKSSAIINHGRELNFNNIKFEGEHDWNKRNDTKASAVKNELR